MIYFDRRTGILLLRLPRGDIPFHYVADTEEGKKDMADAEEHVAKISYILEETSPPWPPVDVVQKLVDAVKHLLQVHDCDCHGYEEFDEAATAARKWLKRKKPENSSWIWMGDGRDDLNSMSCDMEIRITASDLRELISETEKKVHIYHAPNQPHWECPHCGNPISDTTLSTCPHCKKTEIIHWNEREDPSQPTLHDIAMLKDQIDQLKARMQSGFKQRPRCVDCGAAILPGKCRCEKCTKLKPIEVDCPTCCAGPLEKVPRKDCPTCHGTGKVEVL